MFAATSETQAPDVMFHPRVVEFLASHICHDLVSPVGAVNNGIELLEELGSDAGDEAIELIAHSAQKASTRLKCFRLAYAAGGSEEKTTMEDIRVAFNEYLGEGRMKLEWEYSQPGLNEPAPIGLPKTTLNLLFIAAEASPQGGTITVKKNGMDGMKIVVTGASPHLRENTDIALDGKIDLDQIDARLVQPYITGRFAEFFGYKLTYGNEGDGELFMALER